MNKIWMQFSTQSKPLQLCSLHLDKAIFVDFIIGDFVAGTAPVSNLKGSLSSF